MNLVPDAAQDVVPDAALDVVPDAELVVGQDAAWVVGSAKAMNMVPQAALEGGLRDGAVAVET